jgi:hypothetical protein
VIAASHRGRLVPSDGPELPQLWALQASGAQQATPPPVFRFSIPQGPLTDALEQFETVTGISVVVQGDLARGLTSGGVNGTFTAEEALRRVLAGSSLSHRFTAPAAVLVEVRVGSDVVEVSGVIPRLESTKYSAPLVETPQTIQIIPRTLIEEQGATTLSEALRAVPGITMQAGEGGGASNTTGDMFTMRAVVPRRLQSGAGRSLRGSDWIGRGPHERRWLRQHVVEAGGSSCVPLRERHLWVERQRPPDGRPQSGSEPG